MEFFFSIIVIGLALLGMSVGIIFNRKPLQGSCGGVSQVTVYVLSGGSCDDPSQKPNKINH